MDRPTISITVQSDGTMKFLSLLNIENELETLLKCQDALRFDAVSCIGLLKSIKDVKWNKFRLCQHVRLHLLLLRLKSFGRIDLENYKNYTRKGIIHLKTMRKSCRSLVRKFMVMFSTDDFFIYDKQIRKYEPVINSGFPLKLWYLADEIMADAIARDFKKMSLDRAEREFYNFCLPMDVERFVSETNIRTLLEDEIKSLCGHDDELRATHLSKINEYEELAFTEFLKHEESWCWTTLADLKFKDVVSDSEMIIDEDIEPIAAPNANIVPIAVPNADIERNADKIKDLLKSLVEHNRSCLQADLDRIQSFLQSAGPIRPENILEKFFEYKKREQFTQTKENELNNAETTPNLMNQSFRMPRIPETMDDETQMVQSPPPMPSTQQLLFGDNSIFVSSQLAHILDDQHTVSIARLLTEPRQPPQPPITSSCFTIRNRLKFAQISTVNFNIVSPIRSFTIDLKFFGDFVVYCLNENSVGQLLSISAAQWPALRKVFVEVGIFEYRANKMLPKDCSDLYKYLYYLFKKIDLVKDCISFEPDMHSNHLVAVREPTFVCVQRPAICLDGIVDNEILRKMRKEP